MVDKSKCISCGTCVNICPVGAISFVEGKAFIDKELCIKCHSCENACPMGAIKIND
ncbi:MAG: 4Fe-4S binding protein [Clostridia bacterium]|nr:4Fe-4S binding protein [Clostridia bacterium]MBR4745310.1 4Fe-4S binding protein [Clostridia bacterium]